MTLVELISKWVEECGSSVDSCSPLGSVGCRVLIDLPFGPQMSSQEILGLKNIVRKIKLDSVA